METLYKWFYRPLVRLGARAHGAPQKAALLLATLLRFGSLGEFEKSSLHGQARLNNDIEAEKSRKEEKWLGT